jgi:hypothetical protein
MNADIFYDIKVQLIPVAPIAWFIKMQGFIVSRLNAS